MNTMSRRWCAALAIMSSISLAWLHASPASADEQRHLQALSVGQETSGLLERTTYQEPAAYLQRPEFLQRPSYLEPPSYLGTLQSGEPDGHLPLHDGEIGSAVGPASGPAISYPAAQAAPAEPYLWQVLPDGLMWRAFLADPHAPRISAQVFGDTNGGFFWEATLGGRVGLLRYGTLGALVPDGWQWDLEGAAITRLNAKFAQDVESTDYRFGTQLTRAEGEWAMKFGYFHLSSHVGDEYLVRNPGFERLNYVTESAVFGISYGRLLPVRVYGEAAYAFHTSGGAEPLQFQTGAEYSSPDTLTSGGAPFAAINLNIREAVGYDPAMNVQAGWQWRSFRSGRSLRVGLTYFNGHSSQYEFFQRHEQQVGVGVWFDY